MLKIIHYFVIILLMIDVVTVNASPEVTYYQLDYKGSIQSTYNSNGSLKQDNSYTAFGDNKNIDKRDVRYTGHSYSSETGLIYMGARWYDPENGRFLSPDPTGININETYTGFNPYVYAANNPNKFFDPNGEAIALIPAFFGGVSTETILTWLGLATFATGTAIAINNNYQHPTNDILLSYGMFAEEASVDADVSDSSANEGKYGSYTNKHASGKSYHGKGPKSRADESAKEKEKKYVDPLVDQDWTPSESDREAYKDEYRRLEADGGPKSESNYNQRQSPGKRYIEEDGY